MNKDNLIYDLEVLVQGLNNLYRANMQLSRMDKGNTIDGSFKDVKLNMTNYVKFKILENKDNISIKEYENLIHKLNNELKIELL